MNRVALRAFLWLTMLIAPALGFCQDDSVCASERIPAALSVAEELLTTNQGNLRALACVVEIDRQADAAGTEISMNTRYRLALIASNAIDLATGSANVGTAGELNEQTADLWWKFLQVASSAPLEWRSKGVARLIEHGRYGDLPKYLPEVLGMLKSLDGKLPSGFSRLLMGTLYRCPAWHRPQASNRIAPADVPCFSVCKIPSQDVLATITDVLNQHASIVARNPELKQLFQDRELLAGRMACTSSGN